MKLISIFQTPASERLTDVGILAAGLRMAFAFIWPGLNKLSDPSGIGQMIQTMGLESLIAIQLATLIGTLEIISGLFIAVGLMTRPSTALFMILTALLVGMPADTMPTAIGLAFGADINSAMMAGFGLHMLTSIIIGGIFGAVVANVSKLRISGFTKGVSEGLIAGMIAFVVLFIPVSMSICLQY